MSRSEPPDRKPPRPDPLLGGSWAVTSGVIGRVPMLATPIRGLITPTYNYP